ncbi:MAG: GHMP kinase [Thermoproteus sp. AZ2]|uniref:GHMP kinase n=1 Tax=Thermoproteus sp. AZ2 TaxID=1609232 RepID=A0ACC6UZ63_9CREN
MIIPHHVTGFWAPQPAEDPARAGSVGAGILLGEAKARAIPEKRAFYNGADATGLVKGLLAERGVVVESPYPLGYGYAGSAVLALATALANFGLEGLVKAHVAEVENGTGLGDVLAIATGGCLVYRYRPGAPGIGAAEPLKCPKAYAIAVDLAPYGTPHMLSTLGPKIREAGLAAMQEFSKNPDFESFLAVANRFSREVGFLTRRIEEVARGVRGLLGYYAKKGVAVFVAEEEWALDALAATSRLGRARAVELRDVSIQLP